MRVILTGKAEALSLLSERNLVYTVVKSCFCAVDLCSRRQECDCQRYCLTGRGYICGVNVVILEDKDESVT
jgi:hypothetical protein